MTVVTAVVVLGMIALLNCGLSMVVMEAREILDTPERIYCWGLIVVMDLAVIYKLAETMGWLERLG